MVNFNARLPIPENAVVLTPSERGLIAKYMEQIAVLKSQSRVLEAALSDIGMAIAGRAGKTESEYRLSADIACLIPIASKE